MTKLPNLFNLKGRVAIVTGGAGLLGAQFCATLSEAGARVVIVDLDGNTAQELAQRLSQNKLEVLALEANVSDPKSVANMVAATLDAYGKLDILVNCAALNPQFDPQNAEKHTHSFENYALESWNKSLEVNLTGVFLSSQAVVKPMLKQGSGVIINVCSTYGLIGPDQRIYQQEGQEPRYKPVDYSVTKAGVLGFTKYLATYYAGKQIRVNALTPGGVLNEHDEEFVRAYSARTVLGRMAEKDEMNGALLFLASDASKYMTGANLVVDGGWTAW